MQKKAKFRFTTDNAGMAEEEVMLNIKEAGFTCNDLHIVDSDRECRNAYGEQISEEKFEAIDPSSDEAWFDDYAFELEGTIEADVDAEEFQQMLGELWCFDEIVEEVNENG